MLQRAEPQQSAAAAADASAGPAARHLPHAALAAEGEGHAAPPRGTGLTGGGEVTKLRGPTRVCVSLCA